MSKRVLITGAAGGIGSAATAELRSRGATVIGGLDVLINNAGVGDPQSAGAAPDEKAMAVIDINLVGPWRVTSAALPALRDSGGRVVNVASGLAHVTSPFATAYCMSKRGVVAYSDALRLEHGDRIGVTTVYPGYIRTKIHEASAAVGLSLEGAVPAERVEDAARALARASLDRPVRDLATTRQGTVSYAVVMRLPRRLMDRVVRSRTRSLARGGHFERSEMARDFSARSRA